MLSHRVNLELELSLSCRVFKGFLGLARSFSKLSHRVNVEFNSLSVFRVRLEFQPPLLKLAKPSYSNIKGVRSERMIGSYFKLELSIY
jgi:hypothetical protein